MSQAKEYTLEQIADAEKLCQLIQRVPESQHRLFAVSMIAYMNGIEAGIALERDERQVEYNRK